MKPAADAKLRERALDARGSFCVSAPAGSGKTELLTRRILRLLAECRMPEEVLAITFTRKATAEMRHRLLELLLEAGRPEKLKAARGHRRQSLELAQAVLRRDQEMGWGLLQNPGRLRVSTIDSFCHWLSRSLPLLSGLGGLGGALKSVDDGAPHCAQALQYLLKEMEENNDTAEDLGFLLTHLDNDWRQLENLFGGLMEKRLQWLRLLLPAGLQRRAGEERGAGERGEGEAKDPALEALHRGVGQLRGDMLRRARRLLQPHEKALSAAVGRKLPMEGGSDAAEDWRYWRELLLTKGGAWRKRLRRDALPDDAGRQALGELLGELRDSLTDAEPLAALGRLPAADFTAEQARLLSAIARLLQRAAGHLHIVFGERSEIDHQGVTLAALEALGAPDAPSELALRLGCRIRHILVDEFQDTSQAQFMLLERLTAGWAEHNAQHPRDPNTLFVVGDAMQSCYGFRDANVGLFLQAREQGIGGVGLEPLELQCNFRTQETLVRWCNEHFVGVFPRAVDIDLGAAPFAPAVAVRDAEEGAAAELHLMRYADDGAEAARRCEARWTAELALQAQREDPQGSVAILLRSRAHARHIVPALQRAGIACRTEAMHPLAEQPVIEDLLSLSCALLDPWDRFSWLAILRAPWCGLDKRALHAAAGADEEGALPASLWSRVRNFAALTGLEREDRLRLQRFCAALQPAMDGRARRSLRRRVEGVWFALGGPACVRSEAELRQAQDFFSLLEALDGRELLTAQELVEQTGRLYAAPEQPDAQVQLMTMHKAKGLEFDTVILPCLERTTRGAEKELLLGGQYLGGDGRERLLMAARSATGDEEEPLYQWLRERQKRKDLLENRRLFYIACTRAIRRLHLLACLRVQDADKIEDDADALWGCRRPPTDSMARILWEMGKEQDMGAEFRDASEADAWEEEGAEEWGETEEGEAGEEENAGEQSVPTLRLQRLPADWSAPPPPEDMRRPPAQASAALVREEPQDQTTEAAAEAERRAAAAEQSWMRHTGLVLHGALESAAQEPQRLDDAEWERRMHPVWRAQLRELGVPATEMETCLERVADGLGKVRDDEQGRWLLSAEREQGAAELSLQHLDPEGALRTVRVDRCFVADGVRWIVDYKSARPAPGQSLENFLKAAEQRYTPQLHGYAQVFERLEPGRSIRTALYFPLLPHLHELSPAPSG